MESLKVTNGTQQLRIKMPPKPPLLFMEKAKILIQKLTDLKIYWKGIFIKKNSKMKLFQGYLKLRFVSDLEMTNIQKLKGFRSITV